MERSAGKMAAATDQGGNASRPRTVLIVDDHPVIRHGMASLIRAETDLEVCGEAASYEAGLELFRQLRPQAVLLDIALPDTSGLELVKVMRTERPDLGILVVSMHDESQYAIRALRAGASGYLMKADAAARVVEGVRTILEGGTYLSPMLSSSLIFQIIQPPRPGDTPLEKLTARERDVLELMGNGLSTRQIAGQLNISVKTVETHRAHMKEKLGFTTSGDLTRFALDWVLQKT